MRNWNSCWRSIATCSSHPFVGYLWGIETYDNQRIGAGAENVCRLPMRNWNWRSDLLPWWSRTVCRLPMRNWNLPTCRNGRRAGGVCRLPMRNWNRRESNVCDTFFSFVGYLWGIETQSNRGIRGPGEEFVGYLWGIETRVSSFRLSVNLLFVGYLWGIETTLRDPPLDTTGAVCRLPMRNWN